MFGQLADLLDRKEILRFRREVGRERYVKKFDAWHHLLVMLYATIERFDSLCEITINCYSYLEHPEMDRIKRIEEEKTEKIQSPLYSGCFANMVFRFKNFIRNTNIVLNVL